MSPSDDNAQSVLVAVTYRDLAAVREALRLHRDIEERNTDDETPLMLAVATGQYEIAEYLIAHGADIWAHEHFGLTVGRFVEVTALDPSSDEGKARLRVIEALKAQGFPFPAPSQESVLKFVASGQWPRRAADRR
jgi:Ankyrin repeats (3 copies)